MSASRVKISKTGHYDEPPPTLIFGWCPSCGFFRRIHTADEINRVGRHRDKYDASCIHDMYAVYYHPEVQ